MSAAPTGERPVAGTGTARYDRHDTARALPEPDKTAGLPDTAGLLRAPFDRDRARVLHSAAFRRLAGKTQVVAPDEDDVPRTRLTHSLEVAQIARYIGTQLGADADLVDLAGLAHDIGHPPFGHNGEAALDAAGAAAGGFEANAQNLRLLTRLELKVLTPAGRPAGLNLTRAALDAVLKYPWPRPTAGGKFGVYADDEKIFGWVREGVPAPTARSLEAQVMDWADDVAYSVHDVEDAILSGRIDPARLADATERNDVVRAAGTSGYSDQDATLLRDVLDGLLALPAVADGLAAAGAGLYRGAALKGVTSELTGRFATAAVVATRAVAGAAPLHRYDCDLTVPPVIRAEVALLKAMAAHYVMADAGRRRVQQRQQELLTDLVAAMGEPGTPGLDPLFAAAAEAAERAGDEAARIRAVLDQVSLLTDAQAVLRHQRLTHRRPPQPAADPRPASAAGETSSHRTLGGSAWGT